MNHSVILWLLVAFCESVHSSLIKMTVHPEKNHGAKHEIVLGVLNHPFCDSERRFIERRLQRWRQKYIANRFGFWELPFLSAVRLGDDNKSLEGQILDLIINLEVRIHNYLESQVNDRIVRAFSKCHFYERPRLLDNSLPIEMNLLIGEIIIEPASSVLEENKQDEEFENALREEVTADEQGCSTLHTIDFASDLIIPQVPDSFSEITRSSDEEEFEEHFVTECDRCMSVCCNIS